jgi:hypothetical protein
MATARAHRKSVTGAVGTLGSRGGDSHGAVEDKKARIEFVRVFRVHRVGLHAAILDFRVALLVQFGSNAIRSICFLPDVSCYLT